VGRLTALPSQKKPAWHGRQALAFQAPVTLPKVPGPQAVGALEPAGQ